MKDFDSWNTKKKRIDKQTKPAFCHEREVWWCSLGVNVGFEQDGTGKNYDRPIVVLKSFNKHCFFAVALTGKYKTGKYYLPLGEIDGREASAVLSQVKLIDTKRLIRKIGVLDVTLYTTLRESVQNTLFS